MVLPIGPGEEGGGMPGAGVLSGLPSFAAPAQSMARSSSGGNYAAMNAPFNVGGAAETPVSAIASVLPWLSVLGVAWLTMKK
ncbi:MULTISPECIES: hypothetical protein [unclassified Thalassospira]|uniref:hypothetical protein n=1 Tax=unclassified Thalassospira TaxID=2648997 RepID=UPI000ED561A7|nr:MULTISPECIES: hypothetical protein [unclassified Thalassospira]HAI27960.1 hypothetical protein [Thalassospira sp.]|tara:strand:+ start:6956 stop:7201 length:246 start_codon:yes stop_codon:yes gene_type:complete